MAGTKLLPCPFCGGEPDEYEGEYGNGIYCMECGAMVGEPIHLGFNIAERVSYEQAAKAWNTRAERTCHPVIAITDDGGYEYALCSECDCLIELEDNYCPNCGAKVVEK